MDELEACLMAIHAKDVSPDPLVRALSDKQVIRAVKRHIKQANSTGKRNGRRVYSDPTANKAIENVSRRRRGRGQR